MPPVADRAMWTWRRLAPALVLILAFCVRGSFVFSWHDPYGIHNGDEVFLPYEAVAMWEGVTPRELGWPASTVRLVLSAAYAVEMIRDRPAAFLSPDGGPLGIMDAIAEWSRARLEDSRILILIGRWLLVTIGVIQVWFAYWAAARWSGTSAGVAAALLCAVAPIAVSHSQYVLADMAGVLCLTWLVGLLAPGVPAGTARAVGAGVLVGLAVASKFHFAMWALPAVVAVWQTTRSNTADRSVALTRVAYCLLASAVVVLLLVPWIWSNPVLMLKEFQGVVLSKVAQPDAVGVGSALLNIVRISDGFGWLVNVGLLPGLIVLGARHGRLGIPIYLALLLGALAIALTGRLYGRYALLVLPAVALVSGIGLAGVVTRTRGYGRLAVVCGLLVVAAVAGRQLWASQVYAGALDSYGRAYAWLMQNVKPGDSLAVDAEFPQHLPRTREQLTAFVDELSSPQAYVKKMESNDFRGAFDAEPMRLAVLNDEFYVAHWARRELSGDTSGGFNITLYADGPQYNTLLTQEVVTRFVEGLTDPQAGFDVLLLNRDIELPVKPVVVFKGNPGRTIHAYLRRAGTSGEALSR